MRVKPNSSVVEIEADNVYGVYHALNSLSFLIQYKHAENMYILRHAPFTIEDVPTLKVRFFLLSHG